MSSTIEVCLTSFELYNKETNFGIDEEDANDEDENMEENKKTYKDKLKLSIQMFALNEIGQTYSIIVHNYYPFFYVKVPNKWNDKHVAKFRKYIVNNIGSYYDNSILECKLCDYRSLGLFDNYKSYRFIYIKFANIRCFNKVKRLWYHENEVSTLKYGLDVLEIYECNIPPLLRFLHIKDICPTGWISFDEDDINVLAIRKEYKTTIQDFEYEIDYSCITPLNDKETQVPYNIASYDIEADSSHGDFPMAIKNYLKLANHVANFPSITAEILINEIIHTDLIIRKKNKVLTNQHIIDCLTYCVGKNDMKCEHKFKTKNIEDFFTKDENDDEDEDDADDEDDDVLDDIDDVLDDIDDIIDDIDDDLDIDDDIDICTYTNKTNIDKQCILDTVTNFYKTKNAKKLYLLDVLQLSTYDYNTKKTVLLNAMDATLPAIEGDKVTFIGTTFVRYNQNDNKPYLNHCIVLKSCDRQIFKDDETVIIEEYNTEKEVLLAWTKLMARMNPDIVMGYNNQNFDDEFMYNRAKENHCVPAFLQLSRNKKEISGVQNYNTKEYDLVRMVKKTQTFDINLAFITMQGRINLDMLFKVREFENLSSYKLDFVSNHYISDKVIKLEYVGNNTQIYTSNVIGLSVDNYIHIEVTTYATNAYVDSQGREKFKVINITNIDGYYVLEVQGIILNEVEPGSTTKWGLGKDDVTPKDIFRLTNEGPEGRGIVAKYCIQDCNLVHHLFRKLDILNDMKEMGKLCSVPMSFLINRGQGIKLTSFLSKELRLKGVLIKVIPKGASDSGYEGALVLEPKTKLYLEDPIVIGDYAGLYPSIIMSYLLCLTTKSSVYVYDLNDNLLEVQGHKDENGELIYDNLNTYEYVTIRSNTYKWMWVDGATNKKTGVVKKIRKKVHTGYKICKFVQDDNAIIPNILDRLRISRQETRKLGKKCTDTLQKQVYETRQLAIKKTMNSMYGIFGATTSMFYEPDIAASVTATGQQLIIYARTMEEQCYGDRIVETKYGTMKTNLEYIYGDTDSVFFNFNLKEQNERGEWVKVEKQKALDVSITLAMKATSYVSKFLIPPHEFEYEKTFMPCALFGKKKYEAIKYENKPTGGKRIAMGSINKRRDNAGIAKEFSGGAKEILMIDQDLLKAVNFIKCSTEKLLRGEYGEDKLIISKALSSNYKSAPAHKVLADRIAERDPGNKPTSGDRIQFMYFINSNPISKSKKKVLQADIIETPSFIKDNNLQVDYQYYLEKQIVKPISQLFALIIEDIYKVQGKQQKLKEMRDKIKIVQEQNVGNIEKIRKGLDKIKMAYATELLFGKHLKKNKSKQIDNNSIMKFLNSKC